MRHAIQAGLSTLFLAFLVLVLPQAVAGQGAAEWRGTPDADLNRLDAEVMAPVTTGSTTFREALAKVAANHAVIADLRDENDPDRFDCLQKQAALLYYNGEISKAREYMKRAARHAQEMGHVYEAAMAYVDAALLAQEVGNATAATFLASRARTLSGFAFLDDAERQSILERIGGFDS